MRKVANRAILEVLTESRSNDQPHSLPLDFLDQLSAVPQRQQEPAQQGVVTGVLTGFEADGAPLVTAAMKAAATPLVARSIVALNDEEIGREVLLMFESGDLRRPIILGLLQPTTRRKMETSPSVEIDGERVVLTAQKEIVLKCGEASITLTRAGKVLIRGAYLSSRSSGVTRIKGGSILLN